MGLVFKPLAGAADAAKSLANAAGQAASNEESRILTKKRRREPRVIDMYVSIVGTRFSTRSVWF